MGNKHKGKSSIIYLKMHIQNYRRFNGPVGIGGGRNYISEAYWQLTDKQIYEETVVDPMVDFG